MPANSIFGSLPTVNELLEQTQLKSLADRFTRSTVVTQVRAILDELRGEASHAVSDRRMPNMSELAEKIAQRIKAQATAGARPALNATGAILHPCLGEPPLAEAAWHSAAMIHRDYSMGSAEGGFPNEGTWAEAQRRLTSLTGAEAAIVTSSRAGALMLVFAALASDRGVVIPRSQLVELHGGWRLGDLARSCRAHLHEIGSVNITRPEDYRNAVGPQTACILEMHDPAIPRGGLNQRPDRATLVALANEMSTPLVEDLGTAPIGEVPNHSIDLGPSVRDAIAAGVDLVLVEGHGLIGGPACCIILGRAALVELIAEHPWARASLPGQAIAAALTATLAIHENPTAARRDIPVLRLLETSVENLRNRAERLAPQLSDCGIVREALALHGYVGLTTTVPPHEQIPTWTLAVTPEGLLPAAVLEKLLQGPRPIVARVEEGRLVFDLRSISADEDSEIVGALEALSLKSEPTTESNGHTPAG